MSKAKSEVQNPEVQSAEVTINTFKDAGYQGAKSGETMEKVAQFVIRKCPDFLNSYSDEVGAELKSGWALRWQELHPATVYSDEWVPNPEGQQRSLIHN